jgi:cytochrome c-type biogenesis protein CcmH/NrfG
VDDAISEIRLDMARQGEAAFKRAQTLDAYGKVADAIVQYEQALAYLPPNDARRGEIRKRLAELGKPQG